MSLLDKIFPKKERERQLYENTYFRGLTLYEPKFTSWGGAVYESELVRASIDAVARRYAKMNVQFHGAAKPTMQNALKHKPNAYQTWSQMLYRTATILMAQNTCIIVPVKNNTGDITGIYPLLPEKCTIKSYKDVPYLRFEFQKQQFAALRLDECAVITRFQYRDDFFGEKNMAALLPTMELMNTQNQAIETSVKNAATYRFIAQLSNFATDEDLAKERARFTQYNIQQGSGGVLLFPSTYKSIQQVTSTPYVVSADEQELIEENIYRYFGVNKKILENSADDDMENAFYAGILEWLAIQTSEALTNMLFSSIEQSYGSYVELNANRMNNLSLKNKIEFVKAMIDRGVLRIDDVRGLFDMEELPDGIGKKTPIRGEYYFLEDGKPGTEQTTMEDEEDAVST